MYTIKRTDEEIDQMLNRADIGVERGSLVPGASFEQGIADAVRWITGDFDECPTDDALFEQAEKEYQE